MICFIEFTKIEVRKESTDNIYEYNETDYTNYDDSVTRNQNISIKPRETVSR